MATKRIRIELNASAKGTLECVGWKTYTCLGRAEAPYKRDVTVKGEHNVDKFPTRRSREFDIDLDWVIVMDGNKGYWIHEGDTERGSSAGCINLESPGAKAVYDWVDGPTRITVSAPWL